jgi:hypothetical protein
MQLVDYIEEKWVRQNNDVCDGPVHVYHAPIITSYVTSIIEG